MQSEPPFPEVDEIEDPDLRTVVTDLWAEALAATEYSRVADAAFLAGREGALGAENLYDHVRLVTSVAIAVTDVVSEAVPVDVDRDAVVAGALLHDISKLYEYASDGSETELGSRLGHPHYAVHLLAAADLPMDLQHIVLAHTPSSAVDPATLEALIVRAGDQLAAEAVVWNHTEELLLAE